jgi:hypothetical protein
VAILAANPSTDPPKSESLGAAGAARERRVKLSL